MTAASVFIALLFFVVGVMLPGCGVATALSNRGLIRVNDDPVSRLLVNFSFGVYVNSLIFMICWIFFSAESSLAFSIATLLITGTAAVYVIWRNRCSKTRVGFPAIFVLALGALTGFFAAFNFPSSLDSLQILQLQQFILGTTAGQILTGGSASRIAAFLFGGMHIPAQSGFAGLLLVPSLAQQSLPVATVGAANKVILLVLAAAVALHTSRQIKSPSTAILAILIFILFVVSQFGLYGLFMTGKDSIFSVLMSIATITALASNDQEPSDEPGIFMSAGILLGVVSVPYLLVFWFIFFVCAPKENFSRCLRQAWWCLIPLTIAVVSVRDAFPQPGAMKISLGLALVAGTVLLGFASVITRRTTLRNSSSADRTTWIAAFFPIGCIAAIVLILPVAGGYLHGQGVPAPLGGKTDAMDYLFVLYGNNNAGITALSILAICLGPFLSIKLRTPWAIALLGFLPATSLFVFLHVKYHWHLLPMFNLWDISRDTIQWYAGAAGGLICLATFFSVFKSRKMHWIGSGAVALIFIVTLQSSASYFIGPWTTPPTVTQSGGFSEPVSAKAFDVIWRDGRGLPLYVSENSAFETNRASYQMFGPQSVDQFEPGVIGKYAEQIILIGTKDVFSALSAAKEKKSSGWIRKLGDDAYAMALVNDGRAQIALGNVQKISIEYIGAYAPEISGTVPFRWMAQNTKLRLHRFYENGPDCITLKFSPAWSAPRQKIRITSGSEERTVELADTASLTKPSSERICVRFDESGESDVELSASEPGRVFPGDTRSIAFALLQSVE